MAILHITGDQLYADMLEHEPNADSFKEWAHFMPEERLYWHALASLENRQAEMQQMLHAIRVDLTHWRPQDVTP